MPDTGSYVFKTRSPIGWVDVGAEVCADVVGFLVDVLSSVVAPGSTDGDLLRLFLGRWMVYLVVILVFLRNLS